MDQGWIRRQIELAKGEVEHWPSWMRTTTTIREGNVLPGSLSAGAPKQNDDKDTESE